MMTPNLATDEKYEQVNNLLSGLGLEVISWEAIQWKRVQATSVFSITATEGRFFLKLIAPPVTKKQAIIRYFFGNLTLKNQLAAYDLLNKKEFKNLRYPKLVKTDCETFLLFEFVPIRQKGEKDVPADKLIASLLEFQWAGVLSCVGSGGRALLNIGRKPGWVLLRRIAGGLRINCGIRIALKCLAAMLECYRNQKPLSRPVLLHNDFHHNNLLLAENEDLYIADFENVRNDHRWIMVDIVHYALGTMEFEIDLEIIKKYLRHLQKVIGGPETFHAASQLRMALLLRVSQMILSDVPPEPVKESYKNFMRSTLLDNSTYYKWHETCFFKY